MRAALLAAALCRLLSAQTPDALERLGKGVQALEQGKLDTALESLKAVRTRLPAIQDYIAFWTAQALEQSKRFQEVAQALDLVFHQNPSSPLAGRAALIGARASVQAGAAAQALEMLARVPPAELPQPQSGVILAQAHELAGDAISASGAWQSVYFKYPLSKEAAEAGPALKRLESSLGEKYPPPMPQLWLERASKLIEGKQWQRAATELSDVIPAIAGLEREQAMVRIAAAEYQGGRTEPALSRLRALRLEFGESEAERLCYLAACLRRLNRFDEMLASVNSIAGVAPQSPWRLRALLEAGNRLLNDNDAARYVPLFRAVADDFPQSRDAAVSHWKALWPSYLQNRAASIPALQDHLGRFPASEKAGAALYYLGRVAERAQNLSAAAHYWQELAARYPNYFYGVEVREILKRPGFAQAGPAADVDAFLKTVRWPERERQADFKPDETTRLRIDRARLLTRAGLEVWAEGELRYGARNGGRAYPIALELAEIATGRGVPHQGVRFIKATVPQYLFLERTGAPRRFWRLAFPYPYRAKIERYAKEQGLDPFLIAALIRQESEFDPQAVSASGAIGLTQIMPGTGREISRKLKMRGYRTASLKNPDTNLRIGTYYLRRQLDARNGSIEQTLAGYNGGPSRVTVWKTWGEFLEPSEFVETIPLQQTRDYVHIILRNADIYRWLYASEPPPAEEPAPATRKQGAAPKTPAPGKGKPSGSRTAK